MSLAASEIVYFCVLKYVKTVTKEVPEWPPSYSEIHLYYHLWMAMINQMVKLLNNKSNSQNGCTNDKSNAQMQFYFLIRGH